MKDWYNDIKKYFDKGLWDAPMVANAVSKGKITDEQYETITGQKYAK